MTEFRLREVGILMNIWYLDSPEVTVHTFRDEETENRATCDEHDCVQYELIADSAGCESEHRLSFFDK